MSSLGLQDYTPFDGKLPRQRSRTARALMARPLRHTVSVATATHSRERIERRAHDHLKS